MNESLDTAIALSVQCREESLNLLPEGAEALCKDIADNVSLPAYNFLFNPDPTSRKTVSEALWSELDKYDKILSSQPYLLGDEISLPDCLLWATLIRYDNVYARQFGLKGKSIKEDYPHLAQFAERIWKLPSKRGDTTLGEDASMEEIIRMYWQSRNIAPKAGNDPTAPQPEVLPVF